MRLIAHRGFLSVNPENTIEAAEAAAAVADGIEIDVRRCGSGEPVVIHDETVDRVTDGHGPVDEHTRSDLDALNVLGTGACVPTLEAVLRAIPDHVGVNVELKEPGMEADVLRLIDSIHPHGIVSSFYRDILRDCREIDPTVPRAYITKEAGTDCVDIAEELGCEFLHPWIESCTDGTVSAAHRAGMSVTAWAAKTSAEAQKGSELGADGVIANSPDVLDEQAR